MGFEQAIVWVFIEVDGERFLDGGRQFFLQGIYEIGYPAAPVIVVAVADEDVVFEAGDEGGHMVKVTQMKTFLKLITRDQLHSRLFLMMSGQKSGPPYLFQ
jgi:hypothetical protein